MNVALGKDSEYVLLSFQCKTELLLLIFPEEFDKHSFINKGG